MLERWRTSVICQAWVGKVKEVLDPAMYLAEGGGLNGLGRSGLRRKEQPAQQLTATWSPMRGKKTRQTSQLPEYPKCHDK